VQNYEPVDVEGTDADRRSLDTAEPIIVGELHCPHIKGITATFENKLEQSEKVGIEVTAAGFGGGGGTRERLYTSTASSTIEAPHCKLICAHLRGHYVIWEHLDTKERMVLTNVTGIHGLFLDSLTGAPGYEDSHLCEHEDNYSRCFKELNSGVSATKELMEWLPLARTPGARDPSKRTDEWSTSREYTGNWGGASSEYARSRPLTHHHYALRPRLRRMLPHHSREHLERRLSRIAAVCRVAEQQPLAPIGNRLRRRSRQRRHLHTALRRRPTHRTRIHTTRQQREQTHSRGRRAHLEQSRRQLCPECEHVRLPLPIQLARATNVPREMSTREKLREHGLLRHGRVHVAREAREPRHRHE
jgi:hypothetical protein